MGIIQGGDSSYAAARVAGQWMLVVLALHIAAMALFFRRRARRSRGIAKVERSPA